MAKKRETATSAKAEEREKAVGLGSGEPSDHGSAGSNGEGSAGSGGGGSAGSSEKAARASVADPLKDLFEVGTWRGRPRWQCNVCAWDTLKGEKAIREHIVSAHLPPPPKAPTPKIVRVNRFGRVIGGK